MGPDLAKFLEALPVAATSPYAFVAYSITVVAWLTIAWRTARSKQLLNHLQAVPERDRAKLLRDEMGVVPPKENLSPEQWLRSRIHSYYFGAFIILCAMGVVLVVIALNSRQGAELLQRGGTDTTPPEPPLFVHLASEQAPPTLLWDYQPRGTTPDGRLLLLPRFLGLVHKIPVRLVNSNEGSLIINSITIEWQRFQLDGRLEAVRSSLEIFSKAGLEFPTSGRLRGFCERLRIYRQPGDILESDLSRLGQPNRDESSEALLRLNQERGLPIALGPTHELSAILVCNLGILKKNTPLIFPLPDKQENRARLEALIPFLYSQDGPGTLVLQPGNYDGKLIPGAPWSNATIVFDTNRGILTRKVKLSLIFKGTIFEILPFTTIDGRRVYRRDLRNQTKKGHK